MARDMKSALTKSIATEREAVEDRFSRAEKILGGGSKTARKEKPEQPKAVKPKPKPKPAPKKVIRDSFTMPEDDYQLIAEIKQQCLQMGIEAKKGEIVRAGLKVLAEMDAAKLRKALEAVERVKTGRPKEEKPL